MNDTHKYSAEKPKALGSRLALLAALASSACVEQAQTQPSLAPQATTAPERNNVVVSPEKQPDQTQSEESSFAPEWASKYDNVEASGNIYIATLDSKMFHVDEDGKALYKERFVSVADFHCHTFTAIATLENGKQIHLGENGPLYSTGYDKVGYFISVGYFDSNTAIATDSGKQFHIDREGKPLYSEKFDEVGHMSADGIAVATLGEETFHIDRTGKRPYPEQYDKVEGGYESFGGGTYLVEKDGVKLEIPSDQIRNPNAILVAEDIEKKFQYHSAKDGKPLYSARFEEVKKFQGGMAAAKSYDGWRFINMKGQDIGSERYDELMPDGKKGYIAKQDGQVFHVNPYGKPVYTERFKKVQKFVNGYAGVEDDSGAYHIDKNGKAIYTSRFSEVGHFDTEGIATAYKDGKGFHIDKNGKPLYKARFSERVSPYSYGVAAAGDATLGYKSQLGFSRYDFHIDKQGEPIYSERFGNVHDFRKDGTAWVRPEGQDYPYRINKKGEYIKPSASELEIRATRNKIGCVY